MSDTRSLKKKERYVWIGITSFLTVALLLIALAPTAFAQSQTTRLESDKYISTIQYVMNFVESNYVDTIDPKKLYEGALKGIFDATGDAYSAYLDEAMMKDMTDVTTGKFGGLGIYISKQTASTDPLKANLPRYIEVIAPIEDTPAFKAGILPLDLIVKIDGQSTENMSSDDAMKVLRGTAGTDVTLTILRGESYQFDVVLKRAIIEVPSVKKAMLPDGIGYMRIIEFNPNTLARVKEAIDYFKANQYRGIVIDLRNNPGGLLSSVVSVANLFISEGVIVSTKSRTPEENTVLTAERQAEVPSDIPIVLLINQGSASASEILAGALKDHHRAWLMGERSYGKGSVQQVFYLPQTTGFKVTIARYYSPSDVNIDKTGIAPDAEIKDPPFTDEQTASYQKLLSSNAIGEFLKKKPYPTQGEIQSFVDGLQMGGIKLDSRLLNKLIRDEMNRKSIAPVYDLDYDIVLQAAIKMFVGDAYAQAIKSQKTLKEEQNSQLASTAGKGAATAKPNSLLPVPSIPAEFK